MLIHIVECALNNSMFFESLLQDIRRHTSHIIYNTTSVNFIIISMYKMLCFVYISIKYIKRCILYLYSRYILYIETDIDIHYL